MESEHIPHLDRVLGKKQTFVCNIKILCIRLLYREAQLTLFTNQPCPC